MTTSYPLEAGFLDGQDACYLFGVMAQYFELVPESIEYGVPV